MDKDKPSFDRLFNDFQYAAARNKEREEKEAKRIFESGSRTKLAEYSKKALKTTFIGALAAFEEAFGPLWGHGKHVDDLTEREYQNRQTWDAVRTKILNNGNDRIRKTEDELDNYVISYQPGHNEPPTKIPGIRPAFIKNPN